MFSTDSEDIHIYIKTIVLPIANRRSAVHQVRVSGIYRDQGTYLTIGWRRLEGMSISQEESGR